MPPRRDTPLHADAVRLFLLGRVLLVPVTNKRVLSLVAHVCATVKADLSSQKSRHELHGPNVSLQIHIYAALQSVQTVLESVLKDS